MTRGEIRIAKQINEKVFVPLTVLFIGIMVFHQLKRSLNPLPRYKKDTDWQLIILCTLALICIVLAFIVGMSVNPHILSYS